MAIIDLYAFNVFISLLITLIWWVIIVPNLYVDDIPSILFVKIIMINIFLPIINIFVITYYLIRDLLKLIFYKTYNLKKLE